MRGHLSDEGVVDVIEGAGDPERDRHVAGCAECRGRVEEAREGWGLAREADMPEPSPLYWEAFRQQVGRRILAEPPARSSVWRPWRLGLGLATAAALVVLAVSVRHETVSPERVAGPTIPAWSALPPDDEDEGLPVLTAVAANIEWSCARAECVLDLSEEESRALADVLKQELKGRAL